LDARAAQAAGRQKFRVSGTGAKRSSTKSMCLNGPGILAFANGGLFETKSVT
jgi:hypothetical protein